MAASKPVVSASAPKYGGGKGKLESINIEVTDNGGVVVSEHRRSTEKKKGFDSGYTPPSRNAFTTAKDAMEYVERCLGHSEGADEEKE